jgi:UDP-4-amino-4,6-dideoxy-N-acetyl-beta-L-altrosamine transaminase
MKTEQKFLPYNRQDIDKEDIDAVSKSLEGSIITRGEHVEAFEKAIADYCGAEYAVAFNSGTSALMGACFAAEVRTGDRVISTPNTFVSTIGSAVQFGAVPVFVDIDLETGNLNLEQLEENMNRSLTRGRNIIMPVHFAGIAVDMESLESLNRNMNTVVIEDAAHALGSSYPDGKKVGCCEWSDMTVFSFHPVKNITTGEGGIVTTNREDYYKRLQLYRNNGIVRGFDDPWYYEVEALSGNFNMTDFQAALGMSQLKRLDSFVEKRRALVRKYRELLADTVPMLTEEADARTAYHLNVVRIDFEGLKTTRREVMERLANEGIGSQLHYIPVYRHPVFKKMCGSIAEYFPNMELYYSQALSLPLFTGMDEQDVKRVAAAIKAL